MPDDKDREIYLRAEHKTREYQTSRGGRVEESSEVVHDSSDPKKNSRSTPEGKKADAHTRREVAQPGRDSTHAHAAEHGAQPDDTTNVAPFSHIMNRGEIREYDRETTEMRKENDVREDRGFIYRTDAEGKKEKEPIAMRAEREELSEEGKSGTVYFGNFSNDKQRTVDAGTAAKPASKEDVREAARNDRALYKENKERIPDQDKQAEWRSESKAQMKERLIKNDSPDKSNDQKPPER